MIVDFSKNHFDLFDLAQRYELDETQLTSKYQTLQRELHPDRFAAATDAEKRWSLQAASLVNEAYQTLKHPLNRATYLLGLNGVSVDEETDTQMDPMFLMQQMELREALGDAEATPDPLKALDSIASELSSGVRNCQTKFADAAEGGDWAAARATVREWQFFDKLKREVKAIESRLDY